MFLFKLQEDSLNYAGLFLFTGLYSLVDSVTDLQILSTVLLSFTVISWLIWIHYKKVYLWSVQRSEWDAMDSSRRDYLKDKIYG